MDLIKRISCGLLGACLFYGSWKFVFTDHPLSINPVMQGPMSIIFLISVGLLWKFFTWNQDNEEEVERAAKEDFDRIQRELKFTEEDEREFEFTEEDEEAAKEDYERELRFIEEQVEREALEDLDRMQRELEREALEENLDKLQFEAKEDYENDVGKGRENVL